MLHHAIRQFSLGGLVLIGTATTCIAGPRTQITVSGGDPVAMLTVQANAATEVAPGSSPTPAYIALRAYAEFPFILSVEDHGTPVSQLQLPDTQDTGWLYVPASPAGGYYTIRCVYLPGEDVTLQVGGLLALTTVPSEVSRSGVSSGLYFLAVDFGASSSALTLSAGSPECSGTCELARYDVVHSPGWPTLLEYWTLHSPALVYPPTGLPCSSTPQAIFTESRTGISAYALDATSPTVNYAYRLDIQDDQGWWGGFAPPPNGQGLVGERSEEMSTIYSGMLIVGGNFSKAGSIDATSGVAGWDGANWHSIGAGISGHVSAATVWNGTLVAGGSFTHAGGVPASNVAQWDGSHWSAMGAGPGYIVWYLKVYNGDLIAGGASGVRRWDGNVWSPLGSGGPSWADALEEYEGSLLAGGPGLFRWDGAAWSTFGGGVGGGVFAIKATGNSLVIGGDFTQAGDVPANCVAIWNGSSWSSLGSGVDGTVRSLGARDGQVFVGGHFTHAGGLPANHVARWDGISWRPVGSGVNGPVFALQAYNGDMYLGGQFDEAGVVPSAGIARWADVSSGAGGPLIVPTPRLTLSVAPNPCRTATVLRYHLDVPGKIDLDVFDSEGRLVERMASRYDAAGDHLIPWCTSSANQSGASGVYFVRLRTVDGGANAKVLVLK